MLKIDFNDAALKEKKHTQSESIPLSIRLSSCQCRLVTLAVLEVIVCHISGKYSTQINCKVFLGNTDCHISQLTSVIY